MADDAQPVEGQGSEAAGGSPYDSYLQTVPEQAKEAAEQWFRDTSKGLDAKLAEAAELQKTLGPFKEVQSLSAYQPQDLQELLAWHQQVTSSPEAYQEWLAVQAQEAGFTKAEAEQLEEAEESGEFSREQIQKLIDERAEQQLSPLQQQVSELAEARLVDSIEQDIKSEWSRLEAESKTTLTESQKAMILDLGLNYEGDESWVQYGFDRFKEITAEGAKAFVEDKAAAPRPAMTAGGQEAFKPTTEWSEANQQMRERLRAMQS
jgi:hypothetical protein